MVNKTASQRRSLTADEVAEVREDAGLHRKARQRELAESYGVSRGAIAHVASGRRRPEAKTSPYHGMPTREKERYARRASDEPAIVCPACETATTVDELLEHLVRRCPGRRSPHHLSRWVTWPEACAVAVPLGVKPRQIRRWARLGSVRVDGEGRCLLRDLVQAISVRLVAMMFDKARR